MNWVIVWVCRVMLDNNRIVSPIAIAERGLRRFNEIHYFSLLVSNLDHNGVRFITLHCDAHSPDFLTGSSFVPKYNQDSLLELFAVSRV